jgi:hypothetical protein
MPLFFFFGFVYFGFPRSERSLTFARSRTRNRPPSTEPAYDEARERQHLRGRTPPPQAAAASTLSEARLRQAALAPVVTSSTNIRKDTFQRWEKEKNT